MATTSVGPARRTNVRWWYIAVTLATVGIVNNVDRTAIAVVMTNQQFLHDLHLVGRPVVLGLFMSGFLFAYAATPVIWGYVMKFSGARIAGSMGLAIWGVSMILSGLAPTAGFLVGARVLLGVGEGTQHPFNNSIIANWFPVKERSLANSMWLNGQNLGIAVAGVLVVATVTAWGWRSAWFVIAALDFCIPLPMVIFLMRDHPRQHPRINQEEIRYIEEATPEKETEAPPTVEKGSYMRDSRFWLLVASWAVFQLYQWGWATWMPSYFRTARHFSFQGAGWVYSLNFLLSIPMVLVMSYLSDRISHRAYFGLGCSIVASIAMFLGGIVISNPYYAVLALVVGYMFATAVVLMIYPLLQTVVPKSSIAQAVGFGALLAFGTGMFAPVFMGFLLEISGYNAVLIFVSLSVLLTGILMSPLGKENY